MKKRSQQPNMDEWLLDSRHGLHDGDEKQHEVLKPEHFISSLTYQYVDTIQPKQKALWVQRELNKIMSRSLWPRILIARCRVLLAHSLPLLANGHWVIMDFLLNSIRLALHYISIAVHGLRVLLNLANLIQPLLTDSLTWERAKHTLSHSWFELFIDTHSLFSAFLPAAWVKTNCAFSVLELGVFILHGWLEIRKLSAFKQAFSNQLCKNNLSEEQLIEMRKAEAHAVALYKLKFKKLVLNCAVLSASILLFIFKSFIVPVAFVSNPVVPLIFAVLALILSLANHYVGQYLDRDRPKVTLSQLSGRVAFFKVSAPVADCENALELPSQPLEESSAMSPLAPCLP
ncbi:hypothetical protein OQJ18_01705 [Fluoribacter dumoffii]|uniref:hypothetical protein n=1 Tax=Fluoribacter dumoffii TaxID=463 RepID=UPI0022432BC3|nr:hypothetical protein [Fluoribacter dumoffii]MCW8452960.1 hypothetical protein [Fluoribacter dumoffii]MCW8483179.1 hypothetical protein [Fluoribacter dumoffii]